MNRVNFTPIREKKCVKLFRVSKNEQSSVEYVRNMNKNFWIVHGIKVSIALGRVTIRKHQP